MATKEYMRQWYLDHIETEREKARLRSLQRPRKTNGKRGQYGGNKALWPSMTKEYRKAQRHTYKHRMKMAGKLTLKTLQLVYEDNIKKYGTLTCIYCLKPIEFGKDTLEHKQPISKGGTNNYDNLAVACWKCNNFKRARLEY